MLRGKYNLNMTLTNNIMKTSFDSKHKKSHSVSSTLSKNYSASSITSSHPNKKISLNKAANLFGNITNYIPLPMKKKPYPKLNFFSIKTYNDHLNKTLSRTQSKKFHTIQLSSSASANKILSTESTQSTDDSRNIIAKLKKENNCLREKLESQKISYESRIKSLLTENNNVNEKYLKLLKSSSELKEQNENFRLKEIKLMKIIYLIKKQGIDVDSVVNTMMDEEDGTSVDKSTRSAMSLTGITFPDKVVDDSKNHKKKKIPMLDFKKVPEYESSEEEESSDHNKNYQKGKVFYQNNNPVELSNMQLKKMNVKKYK